jgi:hypothetical protein
MFLRVVRESWGHLRGLLGTFTGMAAAFTDRVRRFQEVKIRKITDGATFTGRVGRLQG